MLGVRIIMLWENEKIINRYNRISTVYDWMDKMIKDEWRRILLAEASGKVLEAGIGTGANLGFYPKDIHSLTGVDFSEGMLNYARKKKRKMKTEFKINLLNADIQALPFPDHSFDTIVSTCVFCSVPDPIKGLRELKRVCKPQGKILMLEHMRSDHPVMGIIMDIMNPVTVTLWGANINRDTINNIHQAGLIIEEKTPLMHSIVRKLTLRPS